MCAMSFHESYSSDACAALPCCNELYTIYCSCFTDASYMSPKLGNVSDTENPMVV